MGGDNKIPKRIDFRDDEIQGLQIELVGLHNQWIEQEYGNLRLASTEDSPWSLLLDLLTYFVREYVVDGVIKFNAWKLLNIKKHIIGIVKVIRFFKALYLYFKK